MFFWKNQGGILYFCRDAWQCVSCAENKFENTENLVVTIQYMILYCLNILQLRWRRIAMRLYRINIIKKSAS